jgi:hypothetical protein
MSHTAEDGASREPALGAVEGPVRALRGRNPIESNIRQMEPFKIHCKF